MFVFSRRMKQTAGKGVRRHRPQAVNEIQRGCCPVQARLGDVLVPTLFSLANSCSCGSNESNTGLLCWEIEHTH